MSQIPKTTIFTRIYHFLASKLLALQLFGAMIAVMVPHSLFTKKIPALDWSLKIILTLIGINLLLCTIQKFRRLPKTVLAIHLGCILTLIGTMISTAGYVATVNIYEGESTDIAYRWDYERDVSLGFTLKVDQIHTDHYPIGIKIGVLRGSEKVSLIIVKTGENFEFDGFRITPSSLDLSTKTLTLEIYGDDNTLLGNYLTSGDNTLPDVPYDFKLVAFQDPVLKRVWTDISLMQDGEVLASGVAEVNHPFQWNGLRFYNTQIDKDPSGMPYAGIQIVRDPGIPYVYAGVSLICLGGLMGLFQLAARRRKKALAR